MMTLDEEERLATPDDAYDAIAAEIADRVLETHRAATVDERELRERLTVCLQGTVPSMATDMEFAVLFESLQRYRRAG